MNELEVKKELVNFILTTLENMPDFEGSVINIESSYSEMDSINLINLIVAIEEHFDIELSDEFFLIDNVKTFNNFIAYATKDIIKKKTQ